MTTVNSGDHVFLSLICIIHKLGYKPCYQQGKCPNSCFKTCTNSKLQTQKWNTIISLIKFLTIKHDIPKVIQTISWLIVYT